LGSTFWFSAIAATLNTVLNVNKCSIKENHVMTFLKKTTGNVSRYARSVDMKEFKMVYAPMKNVRLIKFAKSV
jgi:hypothetical protein